MSKARRVRKAAAVATSAALWVLGTVIAFVLAAYVAWQLSPWPSALFYRHLMNKQVNSVRVPEAHIPANLNSWLNERYGSEADAVLDVFSPRDTVKPQMTIVWIHGGGFISGGKGGIADYLRVLAGRGYTVAGVNYTLAPGARYPQPLREVNAALAFLLRNASRYLIDPARIVLAGDSAGAQLAAQVANIVSVPAYADVIGIVPAIDRRQLAGVILHCGVYDAKLLKLEGSFAGFLQAVGWSYFGTKDFVKHPKAAEFSVVNHVTADYPPTFISAGNADPLLAHSLAMAAAIAAKGVPVDRLFYPADHNPPLGHEYQFKLDTEAGVFALQRTLTFLAALH